MTNSKIIQFPNNTDIDGVISYYRLLSDIQDNEPIKTHEGITIKRIKKTKLFVIGNENAFEEFSKYLPLSHYELIDVVLSKDYIETLGMYRSQSIIEKILLLDLDVNDCKINKVAKKFGISKNDIIVPRMSTEDKIGPVTKINFGKNNDEKTFIVMVPPAANGLLLYLNVAASLKTICPKYELYVDLQHFPNQYISPKQLGLFNPWSYYFNNLTQYDIDEIYDSANVILWYPYSMPQEKGAFDRSWISPLMLNKESEMNKIIISERKKILGVLFRGTDFYTTNGHPRPFDAYEGAVLVKRYLDHYAFEYVFLDTEDELIHEVFSAFFGQKLISLKRKRYSVDDGYLPSLILNKDDYEGLQIGEDYLLETLLVSRSDAFLTSMSGNSIRSVLAFNTNGYLFFESPLTKTYNGFNGPDPIVVESHNKNHFVPKPCIVGDTSVEFLGDCLHIRGLLEKDVPYPITEYTPVHLKSNKTYISSVLSNTDPNINLIFEFKSDDGSAYKFQSGKIIKSIKPLIQCRLLVVSKVSAEINLSLKIQIEEGHIPTAYERPEYSKTFLAIQDVNGLYYDFKSVDFIDYESGILSVGGNIIGINRNVLSQYNDIIRFESGFMLCKHGDITFIGTLCNNIELISHDNMVKFADFDWVRNLFQQKRVMNVKSAILKRMIVDMSNSDIPEYGECAKSFCTSDPVFIPIIIDVCNAFLDGHTVEKNNGKALEWLKIAIENGYEKSKALPVCWKIGTHDALILANSIIASGIDVNDIYSFVHLGRAYRDGKGVEQDLYKAAEWMRKAADKNPIWNNELFDILWRIGTPESYVEMLSVATAFAESGDGNAIGRLGRAYRDGKGVEQDLYKAAEWMRKAADKNPIWNNELFDILWRIGTPESYVEMLSVATAFAESGDGNAIGRLGRAYRDGKGVEQDLYKAAEWMRKAADKNVGWANNELFDILWRIGTPESYVEMLSVATAFAESGDGNAIGRLGRAYRDGKGVEKDKTAAIELFRRASKANDYWLKELNEMYPEE